MKTMIAIQTGIPAFSNMEEPSDLFSAEEIDALDEAVFSGLGRRELLALRQKLSDSFDWLDSGDCDVDSPEMKEWERRLDRLNKLMDRADELLAK